MKIYAIADSIEDKVFGPYTKKPLADKILKFVKQSIDDEAEIHVIETDEYEKVVMAGLLPIKISVEILGGKPQEPVVEITWPPMAEGVIVNMENYREYFVWAKSRTEALVKIARMKIPEPEPVIVETKKQANVLGEFEEAET